MKLVGKKQNIDLVWKLIDKEVGFWIMYTWAALDDNAKYAKILWTITELCLNREFQPVEQKNFHSLEIFVCIHGLMINKVMQRNVWNERVSWQTRRLSNYTKYLVHAAMTITS